MKSLPRLKAAAALLASVAAILQAVMAQPAVAAAPRLLRGPYLQTPTSTGIVVRWRTDLAGVSRVRYGVDVANLDQAVDSPAATTNHSVRLSNLQADTVYFYSVGLTNLILAEGTNYFFRTAPVSGARQPIRVWVLGDSGYTNFYAAPVRDAYYNFTGTRRTDVWLMLGDNAYTGGTDGLFQNAVFGTYPTLLRQTALWSTIGNQETAGSANPPSTIAYFSIFDFPMNGEAGGVPSGSERYYSFDHGNVHFICLDSMSSARTPGSPMLTWLEADLAANTSDWTIAFWHHPPYSKGARDSDTQPEQIEMRAYAVPMLEAHGVDLILSGHSHSYERSFLIDGHYGLSSTFTTNVLKDGGSGRIDDGGAYEKNTLGPAANEGAVYLVTGSGSSTNGGPFNHPVMYRSVMRLGSVALDIHANRLDAKFIRENGAIDDYFTLIKGASPLRITAASTTNDTLKIDWNSVAGRTYRVEGRADADSGAWTDLSGSIKANAISATWTGTNAGALTNLFLRIRSSED